jgi:hypothetical protein
MPQTTKKPTRATSTKTKPKKKAVPEFAKPFYKKRWFAIFALILVFSAIGGGYMIRKGEAASYTFINRAQHMSYSLAGNDKNKPYPDERKINGIVYKVLKNSYGNAHVTRLQTWITPDLVRSSRQICAHFKLAVGGRDAKVVIEQQRPTGVIVASNRINANTTGTKNVCLTPSSRYSDAAIIKVYISDYGYDTEVLVDTIYGKP